MSKECVMCGGDAGEYGNNPAPLFDEGVCCDSCNMEVVMTRVMINRIGRNMEQ
jgi:hypothetical protein